MNFLRAGKLGTNLKVAIFALAMFALNAVLLGWMDQPLEFRANGEPKLDLRFGYDRATVERLFSAYGEEGRELYALNLVADTPFPILGAAAVILFVFAAFRNRRLRLLLSIAPLVFMLTDLLENALLYTLVANYPTLSDSLIAFSSVITQIKRSAYYLSALVLITSVLSVFFRGQAATKKNTQNTDFRIEP